MILDIVRAELRDHPGKAIAAFVAACLAPFVVIAWLWVVVPALEDVLASVGVPR